MTREIMANASTGPRDCGSVHGQFMTQLVLVIAAVFLTLPALGQTLSAEDRLREALRHVTVDLRAAQDNQVALQAQLDQAIRQRDALQQQVTQLAAQAAQKNTPAPAEPAPTPHDDAEAQHFRDVAQAVAKQAAALQEGLAHWQTAYQQAATLAQTKDAQNRDLTASLATTHGTLKICEAKNTRLASVANDILHMYETPKFRSLTVASFEPLLGIKRVELENLIQDHEDQIAAQRYYHGEQPASAAPTKAASAATP